MRALILISTCVILLAAMQAAYLVVDARHHDDKKEIHPASAVHHLKGEEGEETPQFKSTEEPADKIRKHHKKELNRGKEDDKDKVIYKPTVGESGKKENGHGYLSYGKKLRWRKCREYPELCNKKKPSHHGRKGQGRRDHKDRKDRKLRRKDRKNKDKNSLPATPTPTPDSIQQILELSLDPSSPKQQQEKSIGYEVDPVEATQELYSKIEQNTSTNSYTEQNNIPGDKKVEEQETSIYDQMIGDNPDPLEEKKARQEKRDQKKAQREEKQKARQEKREQREQKKEDRQEKKANKERKMAERSQRKMEKEQKRQEREQKKKEKQEKKGICENDSDCGQGECCIAKRNGKKSCRRGGVKELSKKCESSCMCQEGLQCFVSDTNKRGKKKRVRPNHRTFGKCTNPTAIDSDSGYFMTTAPTGSSTFS